MVKALLTLILSLRYMRKGRALPACSGMTHMNKGCKEGQVFNITTVIMFLCSMMETGENNLSSLSHSVHKATCS